MENDDNMIEKARQSLRPVIKAHEVAHVKLISHAYAVAEMVLSVCIREAELPRNYRAVGNKVGRFLVWYGPDGYGEVFGPKMSRRLALQLAEDVRTGWLEEVAEFLENRVMEDDDASRTLMELGVDVLSLK